MSTDTNPTSQATLEARAADSGANATAAFRKKQRALDVPTERGDAIATDALYPRVRGADYFALGPRFDASRLCAADADLIVGDVLIELKTKLGRKDDEGQRFDVLQTKDLYQVVAYALFDRSDEYGIRDVAIYSARYGHYFERRLEALLDELAGRPVDLPAERTRVWQILATA